MCEQQEDLSEIVVRLKVSNSTAITGPTGPLRVTTLTHPSLKGELHLIHMSDVDRGVILREISISSKEIDPISSLFEHISSMWNKE